VKSVTHCRSDFIIESSTNSHTAGSGSGSGGGSGNMEPRGTRTTTTITKTGTFDHANPKRKKLIKKSEAVSQLYPKFFRHYNHVGEATIHRFSHLFCFGFYALVFDNNLQILSKKGWWRANHFFRKSNFFYPITLKCISTWLVRTVILT